MDDVLIALFMVAPGHDYHPMTLVSFPNSSLWTPFRPVGYRGLQTF